MLRYPCLVLDHDDTVVQSEATVNFPYFQYILNEFRPGATITMEQYISGCCHLGFADMCRQWYGFTEQELVDEYEGWQGYIMEHVPAPFPGIGNIIRRQKEAGGLICVVSHSSNRNILRDYRQHFGIEPDAIYSWDLPEEKRKPSSFALEDIMTQFHLNREELLVVDDMKPAWEMATKVSVPIAFAAWGRKEYPQIADEMRRLCDFSFDSPKELEAFLFQEKAL